MTDSVIDRTIGYRLGGVEATRSAFARPLGEGIYAYARRENPTVAACERALAKVENARWCFLLPSGMAAINLALSLFNNPKDRRPYVFPADVYSGTHEFALRILRDQRGVNIRFADPDGQCSMTEALINTIKDESPAVVFIEPISNPILDIIDVEKVAAAARDCGAVVIVDNTFATPLLFRPLAHGADMVVHSATKYLGGHNNILSGVIALNNDDLRAQAHLHRTMIGSVMSPDDAGRLKTQLLTFPIRVARQNDNAMRIAAFLNQHRSVAKVCYPGLATHDGHDLAKRMFADRGFGAMITFDLAAGANDASRFVDELSPLIPHIGSLGDVHTSFLHVQACVGDAYGASTIRLSIGIEPADEIIGHLSQAFETMA